MTAYTDNTNHVIREQARKLDGDYAGVLLTEGEVATMLLPHVQEQALYNVAADETGMWVFMEDSINKNDANAEPVWQPYSTTSTASPEPIAMQPAPSPELPTTPMLAETVESSNISPTWWVAGGAVVSGLLAVGLLADKNHGNSSDDALPKPEAVVLRYTAAKNPTATDTTPTPQAETPPKTPKAKWLALETDDETSAEDLETVMLPEEATYDYADSAVPAPPEELETSTYIL